MDSAKPDLLVLLPKLSKAERTSIVVVRMLVLVGLSRGSPIVTPNTHMKEVNTSEGRDCFITTRKTRQIHSLGNW
jgi:hypothetical protein